MTRLIIAAVAAAGVLMTSLAQSSGLPDEPMGVPRVQALKGRIGYDEALATERTSEHVALALESFPVPEILRAWSVDREVTKISESESMLRMRFRSDEARITIRVSVFGVIERARVAEKFLLRADAVMTKEITAIRGPKELGTISLMSPDSTLVYWIYRNVYSEVIAHKSSVTAVELGLWLQRQFEQRIQAR